MLYSSLYTETILNKSAYANKSFGKIHLTKHHPRVQNNRQANKQTLKQS